ncbi:MAG TPA: class I SAM-dependent methyltransferase [Bacteroidia bacterium]|nr:class I SAM-dependent methyltransferase [Bacteroidia bacterium]
MKIEDGLVYHFQKESEQKKFYDTFYTDSTPPVEEKIPELLTSNKAYHFELGEAYRRMEEIISSLEKRYASSGIVIELGGSMYQERSANAYKRLKNYFPLDLSYSSIRAYASKYNRPGIVCDAQQLPFKDASVDCILTHTFLEHPHQPEQVLDEIIRVLKPGGYVIHNDAWFCRWWHRFGLIGLKKFSSMTGREKMIALAARITEFKFFRIPPIILRRFLSAMLFPKQVKRNLVYNKLKPNYTLHLGCDEDAASNLDPVAVIRYYEARGFRTLQPLTFRQRLLYPNKPIHLVKF